MSLPNFHQVTATDQFQALLSQDLNRVSVINFCAPWAEPCKQMNEVVKELAKKYEGLLFLEVDAEQQSEISESFEVESVPTFVLLRGHTLLDRVAGADAAALTASVTKHAQSPPQAQSHTDKPPAAAPTHVSPPPNGKVPAPVEAEKTETLQELEARMRGIMNQSKVVLFMKGNPGTPRCGFSRKTVEILRDQKVEFTSFDILQDEAVRQGLKKFNDWPTFPQLIINGEFVGGLDIIKEMVETEELQELLAR